MNPRRIAALILISLTVAACAGHRRSTPSPGAIGNGAGSETSTEAWTFEGREGKLIRTASYRVHTTLAPGATVDRFPVFMEAALEQYTSVLGPLPRPQSPMQTFVMADRPQWTRLTQRLMGSESEVYLRIQRGGYTARGRSILFFIGPRDTLAIAAHEGWHQYTQTAFQNALPVWLEEGMATYMEGFRWAPDLTHPAFLPWANFERFDMLQGRARSGRLIPLERLLFDTPQDLMEKDPDAALGYYAQVWALVHFLVEGEGGVYRGALRQMLADAADGRLVGRIARERGQSAASNYLLRRRGADALLSYVAVPLGTLQRQYDEFVTNATRMGAKQFIVNGRSPIE